MDCTCADIDLPGVRTVHPSREIFEGFARTLNLGVGTRLPENSKHRDGIRRYQTSPTLSANRPSWGGGQFGISWLSNCISGCTGSESMQLLPDPWTICSPKVWKNDFWSLSLILSFPHSELIEKWRNLWRNVAKISVLYCLYYPANSDNNEFETKLKFGGGAQMLLLSLVSDNLKPVANRVFLKQQWWEGALRVLNLLSTREKLQSRVLLVSLQLSGWEKCYACQLMSTVWSREKIYDFSDVLYVASYESQTLTKRSVVKRGDLCGRNYHRNEGCEISLGLVNNSISEKHPTFEKI